MLSLIVLFFASIPSVFAWNVEAVVGSSATYTFSETQYGYVEITSVTTMGEGFSAENTGCVTAGDSKSICTIEVTFRPKSIGLQIGTVSVSLKWGKYTAVNKYTIEGYGTEVRSSFGEMCLEGSIIQVDSRSLREEIPLVGVPFSLFYSSQLAEGFKPKYPMLPKTASYNPDSLTPSIHHYLDVSSSRIYLGNGTTQAVVKKKLSDGNFVVDGVNDTAEAYVFAADGKHIGTRTRRLGAWIYQFEYDAEGRLASVVYGNQTLKAQFLRSTNGNLASIQSAYGQTTKIETIGNQITSITSPGENAYRLSYLPNGLLTEFIKPGGQTSRFEYDEQGMLKFDVHSGGKSTSISVISNDIRRKVFSITSSTGLVKQVSSEAKNENSGSGAYYLRTEYTPDGITKWINQRKESNEVIIGDQSLMTATRLDPRFGSQRTSWESIQIGKNPWGANGLIFESSPTSVEDPFDYKSTKTTYYRKTAQKYEDTGYEVFDKQRRASTLTSVEGIKSSVIFDSNDRPASVQVGIDLPVNYTYDASGRLLTLSQNTRVLQSISYDSQGYIEKVTNSLGHSKKFKYDVDGRNTEVELEDGRVVALNYDENGKLLSVAPAHGKVHKFLYNALELLSLYIPPPFGSEISSVKFEYDTEKGLVSKTLPSGKYFKNIFNSITGKVDEIETSDGRFLIDYEDGKGLPKYVANPWGIVNQYQYFGTNLQSKTLYADGKGATGTIAVGYDNFYRKNQLRVTTRRTETSIKFGLNRDGMPVQIGDQKISYEYPSGRISKRTIGQIVETRKYDDYGSIKNISVVFGSSSKQIFSSNLTRDELGRIIKKDDQIMGKKESWSFVYDQSGRLISTTKDGQPFSSYFYDSNGNRIKGVHAGLAFSSQFDDQDRIIKYNETSYSHDLDGNLETVSNAGFSKSYKYDFSGALTEVSNTDGLKVLYIVDNEGNPVKVYENKKLVYQQLFENGARLTAQINSAEQTTVFVHGTSINTPDYMVRDGKTYVYVKDHLGSVRLLIGAKFGSVAQEIHYSDLGKVLSDSAPGFQPYGFAGGLYSPQSGLVRFAARHYDAETGRWISKDPILFGGGDTNLYGYVVQDPVNLIDPSGRFAIFIPAILLPALPAIVEGAVLVASAAGSAWGISEAINYFNEKRPYPNGPPGGSVTLPNGDKRIYDEKGNPVRDEDWGHDRGHGVPHVHDWVPNADGGFSRGRARPPKAGECK